jgi:hypothetical protein
MRMYVCESDAAVTQGGHWRPSLVCLPGVYLYMLPHGDVSGRLAGGVAACGLVLTKLVWRLDLKGHRELLVTPAGVQLLSRTVPAWPGLLTCLQVCSLKLPECSLSQPCV